jgi:5'-3' exonuclease
MKESENSPQIALIDADPLFYIVGWKMGEEETSPDKATQLLDAIIESMRMACFAESVILCCGADKESFRHTIYRYAKYKGARQEKPVYFQRWEPVLRRHMVEAYGMQCVNGLEADDLLGYGARILGEGSAILCSPDKDIKQVAGMHFNYNRMEKGERVMLYSEEEAHLNFWTQMLTGDTEDNIKGVPGLGPDKVSKLFAASDNLPRTVKEAYIKYFGEYYGPVIMAETRAALELVSTPTMAHTWGNLIDLVQLEQFDAYVQRKRQESHPANIFAQ